MTQLETALVRCPGCQERYNRAAASDMEVERAGKVYCHAECPGIPAGPSRFRKRPVVIEAVQLREDDDNGWDWIAEWCGGRIYNVEPAPGAEPETLIDITTLEGVMTACRDDWIIRGVQGEFYPCKPDIFDATYEPVDV